MAKLLARHRLVVYMPGLRYLQAAIFKRANVSTYSGGQRLCTSHEGYYTDTDSEAEFPYVELPDPSVGPLTPRDPRFPFTGSVGVASSLYPQPGSISTPVAEPDILTKKTTSERHFGVFAQFVKAAADADEEAEIEKATKALQNHPTALECIAQDCPDNVRKSFLDLFPGVASKSLNNMTVLTLCQRTQNDMTSWNTAVEKEREELLKIFITSASEMCRLLKEAGFWADFIDPSSGQAFLGDCNPNTSLFETDERFKQLGFDIEDLGCCKCIRHSIWGTHVFVGAIFTNASPDNSIVKDIMFTKDFTK